MGESVNFTDLSTNLPDSWYWEFEGGSPSTSTEQNPQGIVYNTAGTFTVTLIATNSIGSDTAIKTGYIIVSPPSYCDASVSNEYEYISNVTIGSDINNNSNWSGYADYSSMVANTVQGGQLNISVSIGNLYSTDVLYAWIDWNYDGDFDDAGELVYSNNNNLSTYNFTVNVPTNAAIATTRMRIRLNDANENPQTTPCGTTSYGEVEDYSINISQAVNNEAEIFAGTIIYPNPVSKTLFINAKGNKTFSLFDITGHKIKSGNINGKTAINMNNLPKGVYILNIDGRNYKVVKN